MTLEGLKEANELARKAKRLNEQLQRVLRIKNSGEPFGIYSQNGSDPDAPMTDLPAEVREAVFAVITNALETELARTANDFSDL